MSQYSAEVAKDICERVANGDTLQVIATSYDVSIGTILKWLREIDGFASQYARAREDQAEFYLDEIIAISDESSQDKIANEDGTERTDSEAIQRSKLKVDTRKWVMSKLAPKKYGDSNKIDLNVSSLTELSDEQLDNIITQATERLKQNA